MRSLLHEPLFHFLLLGAALFAAYGFFNRAPHAQPGEIIVSAGQIEHLAASLPSSGSARPRRRNCRA